MTPTARLTHALRSLADALEGPLPCSDPEMPARRFISWAEDLDRDIVAVIAATVNGTNALDALCDAGLCDE